MVQAAIGAPPAKEEEQEEPHVAEIVPDAAASPLVPDEEREGMEVASPDAPDVLREESDPAAAPSNMAEEQPTRPIEKSVSPPSAWAGCGEVEKPAPPPSAWAGCGDQSVFATRPAPPWTPAAAPPTESLFASPAPPTPAPASRGAAFGWDDIGAGSQPAPTTPGFGGGQLW